MDKPLSGDQSTHCIKGKLVYFGPMHRGIWCGIGGCTEAFAIHLQKHKFLCKWRTPNEHHYCRIFSEDSVYSRRCRKQEQPSTMHGKHVKFANKSLEVNLAPLVACGSSSLLLRTSSDSSSSLESMSISASNSSWARRLLADLRIFAFPKMKSTLFSATPPRPPPEAGMKTSLFIFPLLKKVCLSTPQAGR